MNDAFAAYVAATITTGQTVAGATLLMQPTDPTQTAKLTAHLSATPKVATPQGITATVLQCKDADIPKGTKVCVTGYTATVPTVYRQQAIGAPLPKHNVTIAFDWSDLEFDNKGAAVVLEAMSVRIAEALSVARLLYPEGAIPDHVHYLANAYNQAQTDLVARNATQPDEEEQQTQAASPYGYVDDLPVETLLLPEVWEKLLGLDIMDWDGWNDVHDPKSEYEIKQGRYLGNPCTRKEFTERSFACTQYLQSAVELAAHEAEVTQRSITQLCADYPDLERYIATLEREAGRKRPPTGAPSNRSINELCALHPELNQYVDEIRRDAHLAGRNEVAGGARAVTVRPVSPASTQKRAKLPDTRPSVTHKFDVGGQKGYITVGCYDKACEQPGEVFITVQKEGSTLQGFASAWARSVSMLLQYGVPVADVVKMFAWHKFDPRGHTPDKHVTYAHSIVDYVARWLGHMFIEGYMPEEPKPIAAVEVGA